MAPLVAKTMSLACAHVPPGGVRYVVLAASPASMIVRRFLLVGNSVKEGVRRNSRRARSLLQELFSRSRGCSCGKPLIMDQKGRSCSAGSVWGVTAHMDIEKLIHDIERARLPLLAPLPQRGIERCRGASGQLQQRTKTSSCDVVAALLPKGVFQVDG